VTTVEGLLSKDLMSFVGRGVVVMTVLG